MIGVWITISVKSDSRAAVSVVRGFNAFLAEGAGPPLGVIFGAFLAGGAEPPLGRAGDVRERVRYLSG